MPTAGRHVCARNQRDLSSRPYRRATADEISNELSLGAMGLKGTSPKRPKGAAPRSPGTMGDE